jgi:D-glycero-D-manno-heptose 1,7-bisphosphate phosphatase
LAKFVLLDRDGVINRRIRRGYVTSWKQFIFLPGVLEGLRRLTVEGYAIVVVSNQAAVGKGLMTLASLDEITRRFVRQVRAHGGLIREVYYCMHRKEARCRCRKPRPGLLLRAQTEHHFRLSETYLIGDSPSDLMAAGQAGCPMIMVHSNPVNLPNRFARPPEFMVPDFPAAVDALLRAPSKNEQLPDPAV